MDRPTTTDLLSVDERSVLGTWALQSSPSSTATISAHDDGAVVAFAVDNCAWSAGFLHVEEGKISITAPMPIASVECDHGDVRAIVSIEACMKDGCAYEMPVDSLLLLDSGSSSWQMIRS